ncbi:MAG: hypothetical protein E7369_06090 [Clostridiales bacterium]|nr:hypothetical protein [Clostridiales bacterium]
MYSTIRPGKFWYDTNGKRIQAHGGSIIFAEGKFWWYGENKEGVTGRAFGTPCKDWHHGVKLYSSTDLYNWVDEGFALPESDDKDNPFYSERIMDRPHIIYNELTKKYVMWAKTVGSDFTKCKFSVCVGDDLHSFKFIKEFEPKPFHAGDFDLFKVGSKAYVVYENPHTEMVLHELTDDYTGVTDVYSSHLKLECPPFVREAPAYFERNGRRYVFTSGTTGYFPNRTILYDITDLHGEWVDLGDPCVDDVNHNTFHSQISSVFKHPFIADLYIALGDRWLTDLSVDMPDMDQVFLGMFSKDGRGLKMDHFDYINISDENTQEANYVWLPVDFSGKTPLLKWKSAWTIESPKK